MKRPLKLSVGPVVADLRYKSIQVVAIKVEGECPEVTMVEDRGIQLIASRVIETFGPKHDPSFEYGCLRSGPRR